MDSLLRALQDRRREMLSLLRRFVECESPSTSKQSVDRFGRLVARAAADFGGVARTLPSSSTGAHLRIEFSFRRRGGSAPLRANLTRQILLLGHLDTVWETGTLARMPFRVTRARAYGPGVFDMKGGIVVALFALDALRRAEVPVAADVVMLLNGDEEVGSPSSRRFTEAEAKRSCCVLVIEPASGLEGALKTSRKGVGEYQLRVVGRAAHAGLDPESGASAIDELCRQLVRIESARSRLKRVGINVGVIRGGTRSNVVAADAVAGIDVRIERAADAAQVERLFRSLRPVDKRTRITVTGGINRPPFERSQDVAALFARAKQVAAPLGIDLRDAAVGGGSDGNFTAALRVPTLDGLGAVGEGAHAANENVVIAELPRRAALLARLLQSLASDPPRCLMETPAR